MSALTEGATADWVDTHGTGPLMNNTRVTDQQKDAAWATLARHGALDLCEMLGVDR